MMRTEIMSPEYLIILAYFIHRSFSWFLPDSFILLIKMNSNSKLMHEIYLRLIRSIHICYNCIPSWKMNETWKYECKFLLWMDKIENMRLHQISIPMNVIFPVDCTNILQCELCKNALHNLYKTKAKRFLTFIS